MSTFIINNQRARISSFLLNPINNQPLLFLNHLVLRSTIHTPTTNLKPTSLMTGAPSNRLLHQNKKDADQNNDNESNKREYMYMSTSNIMIKLKCG
ncbi:hypothetical protein HanXRQr2_Chr01g0035871 [Helianthus annuus]|uniref:Uncharacterized protein n=1 Tax=Helianthus annuus TaxID=4232 RepID=A0A9K3JYR8_HELAN|nr:hypothetical protein HanXRQr2_Chr01g0035871 [Helianthus annuus]KAJ0958031.1 hypothetical protein HanPSC8_Chr01g0034521 [Helianthus annuus]